MHFKHGQYKKPIRFRLALLSIVLMCCSIPFSPAQTNWVLQAMENLEKNRDPKCHATASRLEDFIYGTPLSPEARDAKNVIQKTFLQRLWQHAASLSTRTNESTISGLDMTHALNTFFKLETISRENVRLRVGAQSTNLNVRDLDQYSSIAYSLRALLALQQDNLFSDAPPLPTMTPEAVVRAKAACDVFALGILRSADQSARKAKRNVVSDEDIYRAWQLIEHHLPAPTPETSGKTAIKPPNAKTEMLNLVAAKVRSYQAYNQISNAVFIRNIQVYFARKRWPDKPDEATAFRRIFTEQLIGFAKTCYRNSSQQANNPIIRESAVRTVINDMLPHKINAFEDVTFFPNYDRNKQISIEAYDLDAFRDTGLHWRYLQYALDDSSTIAALLDPFAAEYLTEQIAHYGLLLLRLAGQTCGNDGRAYLAPSDLQTAEHKIQTLLNDYPENAIIPMPEPIRSSDGVHDGDPIFKDITAISGVNFEHRSSDWLSRHLRSYTRTGQDTATLTIPPAFGGGGVAAEDLNGDNYPDLLLLSGSGNQLYINKKDGTFIEKTRESGLIWTRTDGHPGEPRQPLIADLDNDGDQDIIITYVNDAHRVYLNDGNAVFTDITEHAGLGGFKDIAGPATIFDYDRDGLLDIAITYFGNYLEGVLPTLARHNRNGSRDRLFRNMGNAQFTDVSDVAGIRGTGWAQAVTHTDFDNDGWQDLIIGNDFGSDDYYHNQCDGTFEEVSRSMHTDKANYTMSISVADLNRDARPDFYISSIVTMNKDESYVSPNQDTPMRFDPDKLARMRVVEANDLFLSTASTNTFATYHLSQNVERGYAHTGWAWDADFFDFDHDGDEDLFVLNGMNDYAVYGRQNPYYRDPVSDQTKDVTFAPSHRDNNLLLINQDGRFQRASSSSGLALLANSRSASYLDIDQDGDDDIVINNYHGPAFVYENQSPKSADGWVRIRLVGNPEKGSNRDAIGASLTLVLSDGSQQWREIRGSTGYMSVHPKEAHFGIGKAQPREIRITWPNGEHQKIALSESGRRHLFFQP